LHFAIPEKTYLSFCNAVLEPASGNPLKTLGRSTNGPGHAVCYSLYMFIQGSDIFDDLFGIAMLVFFVVAWLYMIRFGKN